jgi:hypothetical protein
MGVIALLMALACVCIKKLITPDHKFILSKTAIEHHAARITKDPKVLARVSR